MSWRSSTISEIAKVVSGVAYDKSDVCVKGIRVLRGGNIQNGRLLIKDDDVFLPSSYVDHGNQIKYGDTIIVASTGSVDALGKAATVFDAKPNTQIGAFLRIVRPKEQKYAMLVSMYLNSEFFSLYIQNKAKGTSINNIRNEHILNLPISIPDDAELNSISNFYKTISNKIILNEQINDNLAS